MEIAENRPLRVGACLSLSGRFARFGTQGAQGLKVWKSLDGQADVVLEDDKSDPHTLEDILPRLASECDLLLGPYSTQLTRSAARIASGLDLLLWNHGGSGDDVEASHPGYMVSVLTPTKRYAEPFIHHLSKNFPPARLHIVHGKGAFARQVADGAQEIAQNAGIETSRSGAFDGREPLETSGAEWDLFSAGIFEDDVEIVRTALGLSSPPRVMCAVAAGVRDFGSALDDVQGIYGVGQWFPGANPRPQLGPGETDFLDAYSRQFGATPDYPAVQAVAAATLAVHCARTTGSIARKPLLSAASGLSTSTLFGAFRISPTSGVQLGHQSTLMRWSDRGLAVV
jgi:ABC-type branched-subunit amino acid transport system substrate-binding protein